MTKINKPCKKCGFCPYGILVEEYPLKNPRTNRSCKMFGHDCPTYSVPQPITEDTKKSEKLLYENFEDWRNKK
jgi:hypothetical protein